MTVPDSRFIKNDFLNKLTQIIGDNISNEQFGVSELAQEVGMSRSNLLRKVKKLTNLSASQFIRNVRLERAMEMLKQTSLNVSEISFEVGFSSTSYFIKCFREYYGYPPGEAGKRDESENIALQPGQSSHSHQLAAIMFTDIEGYTSLMQRDEEKAVEFRNRHREVFNATTKKFNGKILQYYGDGTLSTFSSAIDAVKCAIEMQLAFSTELQIPVRIGIHTGDIIFTEDDIIGDGVNVASRIESLSVAGSVFISEKVYDEVKNQTGIFTVSMGVFELKNVGKPMEVFAITNRGLIIPAKDEISGKEKNNSKTKLKDYKAKSKNLWILGIILAIMLVGYLLYTSKIFDKTTQPITASDQTNHIKSIAVLPFINDSDDSTNVYIINGLMESTLNNLQKIKDLRVISRTSVEKYRNNPKTIPEIAKELNVNYFVEGSGQKIGDQISLHIQLIEASSDKHLWSEQYTREIKDIFKLQSEVARNIAGKIKAIITPEEEERINKVPTENLLAYDYFLKGQDLLFKGGYENVNSAITQFYKAIELDSLFAHAYADIAISYYLLDVFQAEKLYIDSINKYADQALLYDPTLPQSLMAKAFFYAETYEFKLAVPYLEKALEYNPNSALIINTLADFYANNIPNPKKYLEYALKGLKLDIASEDSSEVSKTYLHIANAFVQSGFFDEAETYINRSIAYDSTNIYSAYVKAYILYAQDSNLEKLNKRLIKVLQMDTTRLDVVQEIGKTYYFMRDYKMAYAYYKPFNDIRKAYQLEIFNGENGKMGVVFYEMGYIEESEKLFDEYKEFGDNNESIYKHLSLASYYSWQNNKENALKHLNLFSQQDNYFYWVLMLNIDPLMDNIKDLPEFKKIMGNIKTKFWDNHQQIKSKLEEEGLI